jgi:hypothetical protein
LGSVTNSIFGEPITATQPPTGGAPQWVGTFGGKTYTSPEQLAAAQAAQEQQNFQQSQTFAPISYGGQTYNDPTQYVNAVIGDAKTTHDKNISQIKAAYENGLLSFEQKQKLIDQNTRSLKDQLDQTLASQQGYFNAISPDAVQSQQGVMAGKAKEAEAQGQQTLTDAGTALGADKTAYTTNYQNSLGAADQAQTGAIDQANNYLTGLSTSQAAAQTAEQQKIQGIMDSGKNAALSFQNSQPTSKSTEYDPVALTQGIASYFINAQAAGLTPEQQQAAITSQLTSQGFNASQIAPYVNYAYGQVTNPTTAYGKAYQSKVPLSFGSGL